MIIPEQHRNTVQDLALIGGVLVALIITYKFLKNGN